MSESMFGVAYEIIDARKGVKEHYMLRMIGVPEIMRSGNGFVVHTDAGEKDLPFDVEDEKLLVFDPSKESIYVHLPEGTVTFKKLRLDNWVEVLPFLDLDPDDPEIDFATDEEVNEFAKQWVMDISEGKY